MFYSGNDFTMRLPFVMGILLSLCSLQSTAQDLIIQDNIRLVESCYFDDSNNGLNLNLNLNMQVNQLSFWQHMTANPLEFKGLTLGLERYGLQQIKTNDNKYNHCLNQQITLVKKVVQNKRQHSNGIEFDLSGSQLTFGNLSSAKIRFQIDRNKNVLPTSHQLSSVLNENLPSKNLAKIIKLTTQLIDNNINLKLVFYGKGNADYSVATIYGEANIILPPSVPNNQWVEYSVDNTALTTFWQQNWSETFVEVSSVYSQPIEGVILVAETPSGKTLESLSNEFPIIKIEELFIENFIRLGMFVISTPAKE